MAAADCIRGAAPVRAELLEGLRAAADCTRDAACLVVGVDLPPPLLLPWAAVLDFPLLRMPASVVPPGCRGAQIPGEGGQDGAGATGNLWAGDVNKSCKRVHKIGPVGVVSPAPGKVAVGSCHNGNVAGPDVRELLHVRAGVAGIGGWGD